MKILEIIFVLLFCCSCGYLLFTLVLLKHFKAREAYYKKLAGTDFFSGVRGICWPKVSQIKPVAVLNDNSRHLLSSFVEQDYPNDNEVIYASGNKETALAIKDMAVPWKNLAEHGSVRVFSVSGEGVNRKIAACIPAQSSSSHDIIVLSDADMEADSDFLRRLLQPFADHRVGLSTSLYIVKEAKGLGAGLEGISVADFAASVLAARRTEGMSFALGAAMAVRREALNDIGGLEALRDYLADDYQLGNKVFSKGWKIALADSVVNDVTPSQPFSEYFSHQLRWNRTYRICRPGGHFAFMITQGLVWALCFLLASGFSAWGWGLVALWCVFRALWNIYVWKSLACGGKGWRWGFLAGFKDLLYIALWILSFAGNTVKWGDKKYKIQRDGRMQEV